MTQETVRALADKELTQVIAWAQDEQRVRTDKRKYDTLTKIKELAGAVGLSITVNSRRGRPPKAKADAGKTVK